MAEGTQDDGYGCGIAVALVVVAAVVFWTVVSVAALVDPFSVLPPVGDVWADCPDDVPAAGGSCDLLDRYPGFAVHVVASFAWALAAVLALGWLGVAVLGVLDVRAARFDRPAAAVAYAAARTSFVRACATVAALGLLPVLVAALSGRQGLIG